ncbi:MAG TPA: DUF1858 domain-containing protein [Clostridia bacterium]
MDQKVIDLNESVFSLCKKDNNLKNILYDLGFKDIINPAMLNTAGRFMTLKKGSKLKHIALSKIVFTLEELGYKVTGVDNE